MSFDRFSDGATPQPGLFTVWRKHGRVYLELAPAQLDHTFMVAPILASGLGEGLFSGIDFDTILVQFHRVGDQIMIEAQNPYGKAREGSPQERAVALSYPPSVLDAQAVTAVDRHTGGIVFSADLFLSDLEDVSDAINGPPGPGGSPVRYRLDPRLTYFGPSKSFPRNIDIEADLTFTSSTPGPIDTVPDARSLFVRLSYSVTDLPDDGYRPRLAVLEAIKRANLFATIVPEDTYVVASEVHDLLVKTHSADAGKIEMIKALVWEHLQIERVLEAAGSVPG